MDIKVQTADITTCACDTIIANLFDGVTAPGGATGAIDQALGGIIGQLIADGELKGTLNATTVVHTYGRLPAKRVIVVGLGKTSDFTLDRARQAAGTAIKLARKLGARQVASIVHGVGVGGLDTAKAAQAVTEGSLLALYRFRKYVTKPSVLPVACGSGPSGLQEGKQADSGDIATLTLVESDSSKPSCSPLPQATGSTEGLLAALEAGMQRGVIYAESTNMARDLINEPSNVANPTYLADHALAMASELGLEVSILDHQQMEDLGMGSILAVAQGSQQPPKLIVLRYWGAGKGDKRPPLALIGKAVTFDSGGISLKPSDGMGAMKGDMSGGAAVLGAMRAIALLRPKTNVTVLVPAVENMPSGTAARPGDIVKTMSGKTYEIVSTDAEGRMILADALTYARQLGCAPLIDVATLTGACVVALGHVYTGAFSNDQPTLDKLLAVCKESGEKIWPMPTDDEYKEQLESDVADMKNIGGRPAGAITGALFIGAFAEDTPWVHLDIAGSSQPGGGKELPYQPKFGSGVMARTLALLAEHMA